MIRWSFFLVLIVLCSGDPNAEENEATGANVKSMGSYRIEGKITPPDKRPLDWYSATKVSVEGGKWVGFVREDNTFVVTGLPSGSYLVEVINPDYFYEPVRIDINSKGKIRARKVNNIQPTQVTTVISYEGVI